MVMYQPVAEGGINFVNFYMAVKSLRLAWIGWPCFDGFSGRLASDNQKSRENSCSSYSLKVKRVGKLQCNSH